MEVINSPKPTLILGRDFLKNLKKFDWDIRRVRLRKYWKLTTLSGRKQISRANVVNQAMSQKLDLGRKSEYNIYHDLCMHRISRGFESAFNGIRGCFCN